MKPLRIFLLLAGLLLASSRAEAQFSISKVTPKEADVKNFRDTIKQLSAVNNQFFSEARYRAEKKRLRKERNTITCTVGLSLNQTGFDNWARAETTRSTRPPRCSIRTSTPATN